MKAILDRLQWIEVLMRETAEGKPIDELSRRVIWENVQGIRAIAEILPDQLPLVVVARVGDAPPESERQPPERVIDLPVK